MEENHLKQGMDDERKFDGCYATCGEDENMEVAWGTTGVCGEGGHGVGRRCTDRQSLAFDFIDSS